MNKPGDYLFTVGSTVPRLVLDSTMELSSNTHPSLLCFFTADAMCQLTEAPSFVTSPVMMDS